MSAFLSLLLRRLPLLCFLFVTGVSAPSATWGYEAQTRASVAYAGVPFSAFDYDPALARPASESAKGSGETRGFFAKFCEFLAAKTTTGAADDASE